MYNGIEAAQVKGTGLSGYIQRSRAAVTLSSSAALAPSARVFDSSNSKGDDDDGDDYNPATSINPLLQRRTQRENDEMAQRLRAHNALRAVKLRVVLYREERLAAGVAREVVTRECIELHRSLATALQHEQEHQQQQQQAAAAAAATSSSEGSMADRFASALGIATTQRLGAAFDREAQAQQRRESEQERRQRAEQRLVERVKRIRHDGDGGSGGRGGGGAAADDDDDAKRHTPE